MTNQAIIAISIKAVLPTGKTIDQNFAAFGLVKEAHESGDYSKLLGSCIEIEVQTQSKTRRVEDAPAPAALTPEQIALAAGLGSGTVGTVLTGTQAAPEGGAVAPLVPTPPANPEGAQPDPETAPIDKPTILPATTRAAAKAAAAKILADA